MRESEDVADEEYASFYESQSNNWEWRTASAFDGTRHLGWIAERFVEGLVKGCFEMVSEIAEKKNDYKKVLRALRQMFEV